MIIDLEEDHEAFLEISMDDKFLDLWDISYEFFKEYREVKFFLVPISEGSSRVDVFTLQGKNYAIFVSYERYKMSIDENVVCLYRLVEVCYKSDWWDTPFFLEDLQALDYAPVVAAESPYSSYELRKPN